jgi:hypothetical protein
VLVGLVVVVVVLLLVEGLYSHGYTGSSGEDILVATLYQEDFVIPGI